MRVVKAARTSRWRLPAHARGDSRAAFIERLGLGVTTATLLLGMWLAYFGQTRTTGACAVPSPDAKAPSTAPACVNLATVRNSGDLAPALRHIGDAAEREAVATLLFEGLAAAEDPPEHVGALATVAVAADRIRSDRRLVTLNARLDRPAGGHVSGTRQLPVLTPAELAALKQYTIVRTPGDYQRRVLLLSAGFMLAFWFAHAVRGWRATVGDPVLLPAVHLLSGLGLMSMIALRDPLRDMVLAGTMAGGIAAGCAIWTALSFVDFERPALRQAVLGPLAGAVALAAALLLFGSGPAGSGARVNLLGAQPVEAIRLLAAFALAAYFARRWVFLRELSETPAAVRRLRRRLQLPRWKDVRPLALAIGVLLLFFFLQRDLGPALVLSCVFLGLYGVARGRPALVLCGFATLGAGFAAGYAFGVPATVTRRVAIWLDPWQNLLAGGDQVSHSLWALSSGGAWGLGPGVGDPQLIPAGHTDLIVSALGEELGFVGVLCVLTLFVLLTWRLLRIASRAAGDYTFFLALALTLGLTAQALVIVGGALGLLPLAGVVTPFLSYGRSATLANFAALAICAAIARRRGVPRETFRVPVRALGATLAVAAAALAIRIGVVQVAAADRYAAQPTLTQQADGGYRYQYNPRLLAAARQIVRGTIYDRNGLPIASSRPDEIRSASERFRKAGVTTSPCPGEEARCYPLGGAAFHVLGNADRQINWAARNTSFVEEDFDARLKGYDDRPEAVRVSRRDGSGTVTAVRRDYSDLLPLVRHKGNPSHRAVRRITEASRDLRLTLDAPLQYEVAQALRARATAAGSGRGAVVVVDPATGEMRASASYPWPADGEIRGDTPAAPDRLLDRAQYGLYPPGSTFKLVTAVAALRARGTVEHSTFECVRLPDGRVGNRVPGAGPVRDDPRDRTPHGRLDLHRALVVSCNAYFAQLARALGSKALAETAAAAQIRVAPAPAESNLSRTLPHAGYGQGEVVASPLRMARVIAALADRGVLRTVHIVPGSVKPGTEVPWVSERDAAALRADLRRVVTSGSGRALAGHRVTVAGKTGTAQVDRDRSHSWFVGFAPAEGAPARVAFAVIVENAGYGGQVAAPLAGDVVTAAGRMK
jgi:cell division protein FtsW (lipid II flippase)/cell division protein FtsI/penicillin-binding protein 2